MKLKGFVWTVKKEAAKPVMSDLSPEKIVEISELAYSVKGKRILHNINFEIRRNEITTVIGPNGAGKSTLIKLVAGLIKPTQGVVNRVKSPVIGYVPQKISLSQSMPMKVSRFLSLAGVSRAERSEALKMLAIEHLSRSQMQDLSGGEFQRVLLARAISRKPDMLLLDEPLQGIDVNGQIALYRLIAEVRGRLNCAVLMVSHDLHLVMAQTDSVLCLNGHICCHGKPESVSQHPEYTKLFGSAASQDIAIYTHHHDHHHTLHGDAVECGNNCSHD